MTDVPDTLSLTCEFTATAPSELLRAATAWKETVAQDLGAEAIAVSVGLIEADTAYSANGVLRVISYTAEVSLLVRTVL